MSPRVDTSGPHSWNVLPGHVAPVDARDECGGDVAHVDRREFRVGAGERQHTRRQLEDAGEFIDECVARPEHDRRLEDHELRARQRRIRAGCSPPPRPWSSGTDSAALRVGLQAAHVQVAPDARRACTRAPPSVAARCARARIPCRCRGQESALVEDADQVDDDVAVGELLAQAAPRRARSARTTRSVGSTPQLAVPPRYSRVSTLTS